ncbi:hypothetical protein VTP01DRAFT_3527 [Rhizomucor pusillus]|uniref:uncharacterized protein n=1 Tax=Rhizomucor pusillus TaxID=4840 RepID=UPI0037443857
MRDGKSWLEAKTEQEHRLEYFDVVRCTVIDPMHNLFFGTAKRMAELWIELEILTPQALAAMEKFAAGILIPPDMDPLSNGKLAIGFGSMKAAEWKSWCLVYSPFLLFHVLPRDHFRNWVLFVNACQLICKPSITCDEIDDVHHMLLEFCRNCESLYGEEIVTSNMHLYCHLHQTLTDFGPIYAFWLFSYERYNGILVNFNTNQRMTFEVTYMKRFIEYARAEDFIRSIAPSHSFDDNGQERASILWDLINEPRSSTTLARLTSFDAFEDESLHCLLPVQRIYSPVAITKHVSRRRNAQRMLVVIPLEKKSHA